MDSTQQGDNARDNAEVRRLAKQLTSVLTGPVRLLGGRIKEEEFSFTDVIRIGGLILSAGNEGIRSSVLRQTNREFLGKVFEAIHDPNLLEEFLFQAISRNLRSADDITEAIADVEKLNSGPGAARRILKEAWDEMVPKGKRGRPTQFMPERDAEKFLELADTLEPFCRKFLALRAEYAHKPTQALFDFLGSDYPTQSSLAQKHASIIEEVLNDLYFQDLVNLESKARRLAYALAGKEVADLAYSYAIQVGGSLRRAPGEPVQQ